MKKDFLGVNIRAFVETTPPNVTIWKPETTRYENFQGREFLLSKPGDKDTPWESGRQNFVLLLQQSGRDK